jgi:hypothetical protein
MTRGEMSRISMERASRHKLIEARVVTASESALHNVKSSSRKVAGRCVAWWKAKASAQRGNAGCLTAAISSRRLIVVRRVLALLLVPALMATLGVVSPLHVHAYTDHDFLGSGSRV